MLQRRGVILVVDDDKAVRPPPGESLGGEEHRVRQAAAARIEMEAVGGVDDGRPVPGGHASDRGASHEGRDRRMHMDDVVAAFEDP